MKKYLKLLTLTVIDQVINGAEFGKWVNFGDKIID